MKLISLIQLLFVVVAKGRVLKNLRCWHCENARSVQECLHKGHSEKCDRNAQSCLITVRSTNTGMTITRGCKQPEACRNVAYPHGRGSGSPTHCVSGIGGNSVCRCCCYTNDCAKTRLDCAADTSTTPAMPTTTSLQKKTCEFPSKWEQGTIKCGDSLPNGKFLLGHKCEYICNSGTIPKGFSKYTTCRLGPLNGFFDHETVWLPMAPICHEIEEPTCEAPKLPIPEGDVGIECERSLATGRFALGSKCDFKCNFGDGSPETATCTEVFNEDSKKVTVWLPHPRPCEDVTPAFCLNEPIWEGGLHQCDEKLPNLPGWKVGDTCRFDCFEGEILAGPQISTCKLVDNVYRFEPRFSCCEPDCSTESADIVFVINTDFNLKKWEVLQTFLKNFANKFEISPHYVQIGVVGCAYGEIDYIPLDEASTTKDFSNQIDFLEWDETCLEKNETLIFTVENAFVHDDPWFGNREDATKKQVIYIANKDRAPKNSYYIEDLESLGARMFGIGIDIDASEQNHFKSFAGSDVIFLENVDKLNSDDIMKKLISFVCPKVC